MELSNGFMRVAAAGFTALTLSACAGLDIRDNGNLSVRNAPEHSGPKDFGSEACKKADIKVQPANSISRWSGLYSNIVRAYNSNPQQMTVVSELTGKQYVMGSRNINLRLGELFATGVAARDVVQNERHRRGDRGTLETIRDGAKAGFAVSMSAALGRAIEDGVRTLFNGGVSEAQLEERCWADIQAGAYDGYTYNNQGATVKFQQPVRSVYGNQYQGQPGTQYDWYQQRSDELNLRR